ncbi:FAD-binding oxidoreductase [Streptomyces tubercidicus]|uniref:Oxidoreductase n=1 Tax=Streptomyces tubercidicus TaxID=47759 RepID=A0A640V1Z1_9ACTN|nr:FAD-binding protein [Streptomyces tubercidicus]WAU14448.1 FAD-binding protein [Streptomyces tubercidicus]GFE40186.1 oxidoreductase [Streptomyces tubercidicus]
MNGVSAADRTGAIGRLGDQIRGAVFVPGDSGFDVACAGFQTGYRHRPSVVVQATGAEDVAAAVAHAAAHGLPVAVQATGHGLSVPLDGGLLIDTGRMTGVTVDPAARTARIAAGTRVAAVIDAAARYGLAPLNGSSPDVGAVGYLLGGGLGLLARQFGYAADHVRAVDVVTADGRLRHVTAEHDPDLFWALRGAGANFGAVTAVEVDLVPVSRIYGGELTFDMARVPHLLESYRQWTMTLPEELTSSVSTIHYPDVSAVPAPLRDRHVAHVRIAYTGDTRTGEELVAPLRAAGPGLLDTLGEMPYTECADIYHDPAYPHAYLGDNVLVREFDAEAAACLAEAAGPGAAVRCVLDIRHLGGALSRAPKVPNAVGHREARYLVRVLTPLAGTSTEEARAAHRKVLDTLAPARLGRFLNLVYGPRAADQPPGDFWEHADHRRLTALKAHYDPANLFRCNYNILPEPRAQNQRGADQD